MRTSNILKSLSAALLLGGILFVACRKDPNPPPPPPPSGKCNTLAKVKLMDCNTGQMQYVLVIDNKTILEPYGIPANFPMRDNMCVKIGYDTRIKVASRCNGTPATITCIQEVPCADPPSGDCNTKVKVVKNGNLEGCPLLFERLDDRTNLEPVSGFGSIDDFTDGEYIAISYKVVHLGRVSYCMVPTIQVTCISRPNKGN